MKKITLLFVFLMMSAVAFNAAAASSLRGDVNGNGAVDISDVTALIGYVLTGDDSSLNLANADCTLNGEIDISDVTCLIDYVLRGTWPGDAHEWVDLGLPSGTLWATCNVGANSPEEYGDYFVAWGETEPRLDQDNWDNYMWYKKDDYNSGFIKYCTNYMWGYDGFVDGKTELDPIDDAACVNWGASWCMPTKQQFKELMDFCSWRWTTVNGLKGQLFTGPNGNSMFLPAAGIPEFGVIGSVGSSGFYWSRSLCLDNQGCSYYLGLDSDGPYRFHCVRVSALSVRAVRVQ